MELPALIALPSVDHSLRKDYFSLAIKRKRPLRLDSTLVAAAKRKGSINKRSAPKQIEYWAELGKAVEHVLDYNDVFAVIQGLKKVKVESVKSRAVDPANIFNSLEAIRKNKKLAEKITAAAVYF
jgi:hypothetical protein